VAPTGGKKDTIPPVVIRSIPDSPTINFHNHSIQLFFNKLIQLNNAPANVYVTPSLKYPLITTSKRNGLDIKIKDTLEANTTYTVNFGNTIEDLTENNIKKDLQFVFSTGPYIDSLQLHGKIFSAQTLLPDSNYLVMLYTTRDDSVVAKHKPYYYTRTKGNGSFKMKNLRAGTYKLFVLGDLDGSFEFDNLKENIGFANDSVVVGKDTAITIYTFLQKSTKQEWLKASSYRPGEATIAFALPVDSQQITIIPQPSQEITTYNQTHDTIGIWTNDFHTDSLLFRFTGKNYHDSVKVEMKKPDSKKKKKTGFQTNISFSAQNKSQLYYGSQLQLLFSSPLISIDSSRIQLVDDSAKKSMPLKLIVTKDSMTNAPVIKILNSFKEEYPYSLILNDSVFRSMDNSVNDSAKVFFRYGSAQDEGRLGIKITVHDSANPYFAELLNNNVVVRKFNLKKGLNAFTINNLQPGIYSLRAVQDRNHNGKWDTGDYWKKIQPEKYFYYKSPISLRANWVINLELSVP
jgi:uncharacterized protein (DUF2141 family)